MMSICNDLPLMARSEKKSEGQEERITLANPDGYYEAFSIVTLKHAIPRVHLFRVGKMPVTMQYHFLDLRSEGDNAGFRGAEKAWEVTVEGRNLWEGYDLLTQHRLPFIRELAEDRDFDDEPVVKGKGPKPVVNRIQIDDVTPKE